MAAGASRSTRTPGDISFSEGVGFTAIAAGATVRAAGASVSGGGGSRGAAVIDQRVAPQPTGAASAGGTGAAASPVAAGGATGCGGVGPAAIAAVAAGRALGTNAPVAAVCPDRGPNRRRVAAVAPVATAAGCARGADTAGAAGSDSGSLGIRKATRSAVTTDGSGKSGTTVAAMAAGGVTRPRVRHVKQG